MELSLHYEEIRYKEPILRKRFTKEETAELIVPDTQPDVLRVIGTVCTPYLRSKDSDAGGITVTGTADLKVIYMPDTGSEAKCAGLNSPFSASVDMDGAGENAYLVCDLNVVSSEARMLNPRKLAVRFEIEYYIEAYETKTLRAASGVSEEDKVELLTEERIVTLPVAVNEKTFTMTDSQTLDSRYPSLSEIFAATVRYFVTDVKPVGTKAVIKGDADTQILYRTGDGDISAVSTRSPFSQIVELDTDTEASTLCVSITTTGLYVTQDYTDDTSSCAISLEIHAVAQCTAYAKKTITLLSDAYSLQAQTEIERGALTVRSLCAIEKHTADTSAAFDLAQNVKYIGAVTINTGLPNDAQGKITIPAGVQIFYTSKGEEPFGATRRTEISAEDRTGDECTAHIRSVTVNSGLIEYNITPEGAAVRFPVEITLLKEELVTLNAIEKLSVLDQEPKNLSDRPSLIAYRVTDEDTLWDICKKYNALRATVRKANQLEETEQLVSGELILIPKQ